MSNFTSRRNIEPFQDIVHLSLSKEDIKNCQVDYDYISDKYINQDDERGFDIILLKEEKSNEYVWGKNIEEEEVKSTNISPWEEENKKGPIEFNKKLSEEYERHKQLLRYFNQSEPIRKHLFKVNKSSIDILPVLIHKVNSRSLKKPSPSIFLNDFIPIPKDKRVITRCIHCNYTEHKSADCNNQGGDNENSELCLICLSTEHIKTQCPLRTCLRCNKRGHNADHCKVTKKTQICSSCWHVGHVKEDCLYKPLCLDKKVLKKAYCYFCGKSGHFICELEITDSIIINHSEHSVHLNASFESDKTEDGIEVKKLNKNNLESSVEIKVSCPRCAGEHSLKECSGKSKICHDDFKRRKYSKDFIYIGPSKLMHDKNFMNDSD
jgi:hypothetical protein